MYYNKEKSFAFAVRIVKLYKFLQEEKKEYVLSKQVLRSGTSVGQWLEKLNILKVNLILFIN